jgi:hypothetical protein
MFLFQKQAARSSQMALQNSKTICYYENQMQFPPPHQRAGSVATAG